MKHFGKYDPGAVIFVDDLHASAKGYEYMAQGVIWRRERLEKMNATAGKGADKGGV